MNKFKFWITWLKSIAVLTVFMGIFMFTTAMLPKSKPSTLDNAVNIAFFEHPEKNFK